MIARIQHELGNLAKCLAAGFGHVVLVAPDAATAQRARESWEEADSDRVSFLIPANLSAFLGRVTAERAAHPEPGDKAQPHSQEKTASKRRLLIARDAALYIGLTQQTLAKMRVSW